VSKAGGLLRGRDLSEDVDGAISLEDQMTIHQAADPVTPCRTVVAGLPLYRLNMMRVGYAVIGFGLVAVRWPLLVTHPDPWPLFEGVVTCILVAMSLLALLGLRYPVRLLPILLFECAWQLIWLSVVARAEATRRHVGCCNTRRDDQLPAGRRHPGDSAVAIRLAVVRDGEGRPVAMSWILVGSRQSSARSTPWRRPTDSPRRRLSRRVEEQL